MYKRFFATRSAYIMQQHVCTTCCMYGYNYTPLPPSSIPTKSNSPAYGREAYAPYFVYVCIRDMRALLPERKPTAGTGAT